MTDTPWTPGPWEWETLHGVGRALCAEDRTVALHDAHWEVAPADARLIAAAPEMAELLERAVEEHLNQDTLPMDPGCWCWAARDLLARIKGES